MRSSASPSPTHCLLSLQSWSSLLTNVFLLLLLAMTRMQSRVEAELDFGHHSNIELRKYMRYVNLRYPNITKLHSIGESVEGHPLLVLTISSPLDRHITLRPHIKYIGNIHGNEVVGRELLLHLIEYLLSNYGRNKTITRIIETTVIHILPTINPDGYERAKVGDCIGATGGYNRRNVDLNRNFPDISGYQEKLQPETRAIIKWMQSTTFVLSASFHGGAVVVNYPFDQRQGDLTRIAYSKSPDDDVFVFLALNYSRSHYNMHHSINCYPRERFKDGITNGAAWYPVRGGMQDYNYYHGVMEITVELSCCKFPPARDLPDYWEKNKKALINFLLIVHMGVKGLIMDERRRPIANARLNIADRYVSFRSSKYGEYWRLLLPGTYILKVKANGFEDYMSQPFRVRSHKVHRMDIMMTREESASRSLNGSFRATIQGEVTGHDVAGGSSTVPSTEKLPPQMQVTLKMAEHTSISHMMTANYLILTWAIFLSLGSHL